MPYFKNCLNCLYEPRWFKGMGKCVNLPPEYINWTPDGQEITAIIRTGNDVGVYDGQPITNCPNWESKR